MIYTCTLNPSIDYVMTLETFQAGGLNRAKRAFYYPGGKGINVSRVMRRLGVNTTALGYIGEFTGRFITDFLDEESISHQFIDTGQYTRINVKLKGNEESEINGPGPEINFDQQEKLVEQIRSLSSDDVLILAGSVPSSLPENFYMKIAQLCTESGAKLVADTSGKALEQVARYPVLLLKPNHHELGELFNTVIDTKEKAAEYAARLVEKGTRHVIVSMGGEGAVYVDKEQQLFANVPKGKVKNSVGAGDSVVSGFIAGLTLGKTIEESFKYGVAAGSATAFQDDLCEKRDVVQLLEEIKISSLN
ncbi:1-phosphofructokinase [Halobacillus salinarum]|uniref:Tagatose-6-phosphate kinase n=1 Tax=Halobacillus salinarum TaxID=2932257 RepID=A0ABY4EN44_9BACI|nr:1-phosphofructokinase [Halobacillus salinarum]UOQ45877.1 1-phosphofructokinase [Halobacillus salinarum]